MLFPPGVRAAPSREVFLDVKHGVEAKSYEDVSIHMSVDSQTLQSEKRKRNHNRMFEISSSCGGCVYHHDQTYYSEVTRYTLLFVFARLINNICSVTADVKRDITRLLHSKTYIAKKCYQFDKKKSNIILAIINCHYIINTLKEKRIQTSL